ncbi:lysozyme family protein [Bacillus sp. SL00103]
MKRNEINDPQKSIKQGVHHFSTMYKHGKKKALIWKPLFKAIMGIGYIDFVAKTGENIPRNWQSNVRKASETKPRSLYVRRTTKITSATHIVFVTSLMLKK